MAAFAVIDLFLILALWLIYTEGKGTAVPWGFGAGEVMGQALLLFLIVFFLPLPYDRLASAAAQAESLSGSIALLVLRIRIMGLRIVFFLFFVALIMTLIFFLPLIAAMFLVMILGAAVRERIMGKPQADRVPVIGIILIILLVAVFSLGLLAPVKAAAVWLFFLSGMPAGGRLEGMAVGSHWFLFETAIGIAGIVAVTGWLTLDAFWRLKQARQVENLPTSKVRSLAIGLVELSGIVRPATTSVPSDPAAIEISRSFFEYLQPWQRIELFRLDDGTGSVLVDARGCRVRAGWLADIFSIFGLREIVLSWRIDRNLVSDSERRTLNYGDRIYLIGNAEMNTDALPDAVGPARLIIKPSSASTWSSAIWQSIFGMAKPPRGKDFHNVFFLSDSTEKEARKHILKGFRTVLLFTFVWFAASAGLLWSTALPERAAKQPESWRNASWRGPEPNPDPNVMDYTRNERLFRFERYIKSLGPDSYQAIPALIEAIGYKDSRFYEPAATALMRMMPNAKEQVKAALPLMMEHLDTCAGNAEALQSMIIAVNRLGPDAAPAVPKLIEALQCNKTNTYRVTGDIIRFQAAQALGAVGPDASEAVPALREMLHDRAPYVREAARQALWKITGDRSIQ